MEVGFLKITGIICEYNPLHLGHKKQLELIRADDPDGGIVCLMSGNFVQRGKPAIIDKSLRAKAAILCGADLVLELPPTAALRSAEGFAQEGVRILGSFCDQLCFGAENADADMLNKAARILISDTFPPVLRAQLETGLSFPAARQKALQQLGLQGDWLLAPNNILALEYCKAIILHNSKMIPFPILREGSYHETAPDFENPSATAVRKLMQSQMPYRAYIPEQAYSCFENASLHALSYAERAILAKLRTMTDAEFESLPFGSEGLWRKLMHACRKEATLEEIMQSVKSKRYTRSRLDRMVMCAFLGLTANDIATAAPYARVLALNDRGRQILNAARKTGLFPNAGEKTDHPYQQIEDRLGALYGLFQADTPQSPDAEAQRRVCFISNKES